MKDETKLYFKDSNMEISSHTGGDGEKNCRLKKKKNRSKLAKAVKVKSWWGAKQS